MAFKLALSAGHYMGNTKRCLKSLDPNETREWWLNDRVADKIEEQLAAYDGIEILRLDDTTGKKDVSLSTRSNSSNKWGADFYLAIHHNAGINGGSGGGIVAYIYNGAVSAVTKEWQRDLYNELIRLTGLKGNRSTPLNRADLHECREPYAPAVLLELGFMDSKTDVPIILTDEFATKCATACVNVIVKRANLKAKQVQPVTNKTYELFTTVNTYRSASDAKEKKNNVGTYTAGTYYVYNKYPDGVDGMLNITKDSTGSKAGSWINPSENTTPIVENTTKDNASTTEKPSVTYQVYTNGKWYSEITGYNTTNSMGYAGVMGSDISGLRVKLSNGNKVTIRSHIKGRMKSSWLSEVTAWNNTSNGYSGIYGKGIDCVAMKADGCTLRYRVHVKGGSWLSWVSNYNINDYNNGLAGAYGKVIDAIQIDVV